MSKKFIIITGFLCSIGILTEWGLSGVLGGIMSIVDTVLIALLVTVIGRWISRSGLPFSSLLLRNTLFCGSIFGVFSVLLLAFTFFANAFPAALSEIHLTDGKRQIVFVQMSHIGTPSYYEQVGSTLEKLTSSGFLIYQEGVRPGTDENRARFDEALGVKISSETYSDFASLIGLEAQDDSIYAHIEKDQIIPVDLSIDDIVSLFSTGETVSLSGEAPIDLSREILALRDTGVGPLFPMVMRGVLNIVLKYEGTTDTLIESLDPRIQEGILRKRNEHVIDTFLMSDHERVVIVYGALHFDGMYTYLRTKDPTWKIVKLVPYYPYRQ